MSLCIQNIDVPETTFRVATSVSQKFLASHQNPTRRTPPKCMQHNPTEHELSQPDILAEPNKSGAVELNGIWRKARALLFGNKK